MSHTLTIRLTDELILWLKETSRKTGLPVGRIIRDQLESAKANGNSRSFMSYAGAIRGLSPDASTRKGFSRK